MADQPRKTPIDISLVQAASGQGQRAAGAFAPTYQQRNSRFGAFFQRVREAWFGPGEPIPPYAPPGTPPRQFDYPVGYNFRLTPRGDELLSFPQLRAVGDAEYLTRLAVETRKDQMEKFTWSVGYKDEDDDREIEKDKRAKELTDFLRYPDLERPWKAWLRMLLEEVLVIDAATIYLRPRDRKSDKRPAALDILDGGTIRPLLDDTGRRPTDGPAYHQIVKGAVANEFTAYELIYSPRNPRAHRVYGFSPVEQLIQLINTAIRREISTQQFYTEGNIPEALIGAPDNWTTDQIADFQKYWDTVLEGNTAARRHAKFIPGQIAKNYVPTKDAHLKDEFDEWIARVVCFAFSLPPTAFIKQGMNRATAQTMQDSALEEGLLPLMEWVKSLMDRIIQEVFGYEDLAFMWQEVRSPDPLKKAQENEILVRMGVKSADQVAVELGLPLPGLPPAVFTGTGVILVKDIAAISERMANPPAPPPMVAGGPGAGLPGGPGAGKPGGGAGKPGEGGAGKPPPDKPPGGDTTGANATDEPDLQSDVTRQGRALSLVKKKSQRRRVIAGY